MNVAKKYTELFFDLDRTLWDFDANSHSALNEVYLELTPLDPDGFEVFYQTYKTINAGLWNEYRGGMISRPELSLNRFLYTIRQFGLDDAVLAAAMAQKYIDGTTAKTLLFPDVIRILEYLYNKYQLHVLTNGFADVQYKKLENSGLGKFFQHVITSEEAGAHKPSPEIFLYAFRKTGAEASQSLMIGDDPEVDLLGAKAVGMDQLFVNYEGLSCSHLFTFEVRSLDEILKLL